MGRANEDLFQTLKTSVKSPINMENLGIELRTKWHLWILSFPLTMPLLCDMLIAVWEGVHVEPIRDVERAYRVWLAEVLGTLWRVFVM